ncbi:DUF1622 domain-containing protein [Chamaesiphon minutus]|uniref:Putative membrane protein n=1 Tax=Chamaesiphon minutus (strain ATCC 27169 / PCC 6605) TaxID=1173020 RepID=K9UIA7_CHAP6|nr:DUF1622 domain-containing protein [Chamaesiphon minutus]AFY94550.1 putative membrane protein [Chamaesiphon minutus PCC 6605]
MKRSSVLDSILNPLLPLALILGLVLLLNLNVGQTTGEAAAAHSAPASWLKLLIGYLESGAEIAAAIVIGSSVIRGFIVYVKQLFYRRQHIDATEQIRLQLGRGLALGLEFTVASDILRTAIAPTRQDILNLGAIVLLRTLLNYFLEREIRQGEERSKSDE